MFDFHRPGHRVLNDGRVVRLDSELGMYVGSMYRADLTIFQQFWAEDIATVQAEILTWIGDAA